MGHDAGVNESTAGPGRVVGVVALTVVLAVGGAVAAAELLGDPARPSVPSSTVEDHRERGAGGPRGGPGGPQPPCAAAPARTLRVATYNIKGAASRTGGFDLGSVARDVAAWDVDVVALQEVYRYGDRRARRDQPAQLAGLLGMEQVFGFNTRKGRVTQYGTAVLSRHPITGTANVALPNRRGLEQRGLLRATIDVAGTEVDVLNTHLQHTPQAAVLRVRQARSIAAVVAARRITTGNPVVLGGDFNSSPTGSVSSVLQVPLDDTWPVAGVGQGATAPAGSPRARIDRLYHSADLRPLAAAVQPSATSDHRAVVAAYEVLQSGRTCR